MSTRSIILTVILAVVAFLGLNSYFIVSEVEQAIVIQLSQPKRTMTTPGLKFKLPIFEEVVRIEKRILSLDVPPQEVIAADQRRIFVDSFARFKITDPLLAYQASNGSRTEMQVRNLLENILESKARLVLAEEDMGTIVSKERARLMDRITTLTNAEAASLGVEVVDVRLKRVDLPQQNSNAIYGRMISERNQEAAEKRAEGGERARVVRATADRQREEILADARRQSEIIRGEADAEAARTIVSAYGKDEEFFKFYRSLQAYRKALSSGDTRLVLSTDDPFFKQFFGGGEAPKK